MQMHVHCAKKNPIEQEETSRDEIWEHGEAAGTQQGGNTLTITKTHSSS